MKTRYIVKVQLFIIIILFPFAVFSQANVGAHHYDEIKFDDNNNLSVTPSTGSSANDFDFLQGKWTVKNRRLKGILNGSKDWEEFETTIEMQKILLGLGCREKYSGNIQGKDFEAIAVRLFDPQTKLWTDHWADSNSGSFDDNPVTGSFKNRIGHFFAKDHIKGLDVLVIYQWDASDPGHPVWSQAFSKDKGATWEWNWYMTLSRF